MRNNYEEEEPDVILFPRRPGTIVFCSLKPHLAYVRASDGKLYSTTDKSTVEHITRISDQNDKIKVTFLPIVGAGVYAACEVQVLEKVVNPLTPPLFITSDKEVQRRRNDTSLEPSLQSEHFSHLNMFSENEQSNVTSGEIPNKINNIDTQSIVTTDFKDIRLQVNVNEISTISNLSKTMSQSIHNPSSSFFFSVVENTPKYFSTSNESPSYSAVKKGRKQIDVNKMTIIQLRALLNEWYYIPEMFNKSSYPFICEGFITLGQQESQLLIFTRRLGCITRQEDPDRKGRPYVYFLVCGPNDYRAWDYVEKQPSTFKSTKFVSSQNIETKGYAIMAPGKRNDPESQWYAWNDQTGLMRCLQSCARVLKKKYSYWEPTCQIVMFDATSSDHGNTWNVKTVNYIDHRVATQQGFWPAQVYFIEELTVCPMEEQTNPAEEIVFYSPLIEEKIYAKYIHVLRPPKVAGEDAGVYSGIIFANWRSDGRIRRYQALAAAPSFDWLSSKHLAEAAKVLNTPHWDKTLSFTNDKTPDSS